MTTSLCPSTSPAAKMGSFPASQRALLFNAIMTVILLLVTVNTDGHVAMWAVLAIGLFNSIMFPTIFSLAIEALSSLTSRGSGWLCLAIVGGAIVPLIQGYVADTIGLQVSFYIPLVCYIFIAWYAFANPKLLAQWKAKLNG